MEFKISFVKSNTTTPVVVNQFDITAIDIDGNGGRLYEWVCFYDLKTSMLELPASWQDGKVTIYGACFKWFRNSSTTNSKIKIIIKSLF